MTRGRILIVDDEPHVVQLLARKLREHGFEVVTAVDGQDALDQVEECCPDLIVSDLQMPRVDGAELCRRLRANRESRPVPLIFITAVESSLEGRQLPRECQVIRKPFSPATVVDAVVRELESSTDDGDRRDDGVEAA